RFTLLTLHCFPSCPLPSCLAPHSILPLFFSTPTAPSEIYTLSLHDALPISAARSGRWGGSRSRRASPRTRAGPAWVRGEARRLLDRKSTRLNSSHGSISYAVFCLKKKKKEKANILTDRSTVNNCNI